MGDRPVDGVVAFVGLGAMGGPMARRLVDAGLDVHVYDPSEAALRGVVEAGATRGGSAADAARGAAFIVLMLPDSRVVTKVVRDPDFAKSLIPGALVIDMSSSEPQVNRDLSTFVQGHGARLIDAPVSGGVGGAESGSLTVMVGGAADDVEAARPVLDVLGRVVHAGPVGAGDAVKALNNLLSATHLWATAEVMTAGERFGLDPEVMLSVFNSSSGRSGSTEAKWPKFVLPQTFDSGFLLRLMVKDMRIAVALCEQAGLTPRLGESAVALWASAADDLADSADHTEVARWVAQSSSEMKDARTGPAAS